MNDTIVFDTYGFEIFRVPIIYECELGFSLSGLKEIDILIYLHIATTDLCTMKLLNGYNRSLFIELSKNKNFWKDKLGIRCNLFYYKDLDYKSIVRTFDNRFSIEENCMDLYHKINNLRINSKNTLYQDIPILLDFNGLSFEKLKESGNKSKYRNEAIKTNHNIYGDIIKSVSLNNDQIIVEFEDSYNKLKLFAETSCCDVSWFEELDQPLNSIIGKQICCVYDSGIYIDLPNSGIDMDSNHLLILEFIDGSEFQFALRNSSNGCYDGYLRVTIL